MAGTAALLVFAALPGSVLLGRLLWVPWTRELWSPRRLWRMAKRHGVVALGLVAMLAPEILESQVDPGLTRRLGVDFTGWAQAIGPPHLSAALQAAAPWGWFRAAIVAVYVCGYPFLIAAVPLTLAWMDDGPRARQGLAVYALCYVAALPFYLFVPVREVWTQPGEAPNLILAHEWVARHLYSFNDVNNCFPSLHTAISVGLAAVAAGSGRRRMARIVAGLAAAIVFATLFLSIHWPVDVAAGLLLAWGAAAVARRLFPSASAEPQAAAATTPQSL